MTDKFYMQLAIDKAWEYQGLTYPNPAVASVVVLDDKILSIEAHKKAGTSHAEVLALLLAYENLSNTLVDFDKSDAKKGHQFLLNLPQDFFSQCDIYVTLEPCSHIGKTPSCASLLSKLTLKNVFIGTLDPIDGHSNGSKMLKNVHIGICEKECRELIEPFIIWQNKAFVLFKLAQTSNGRIGGGYLSSHNSLVHVHKLREACSLMLIGGNTVRADRPTLDCRFIDAKPPSVKIYSKDDSFDKEIPLFAIKEREVEIVNRLDFLDKPSFVLVEGGEGMLNALKNHIDWLLIYLTPKLSTNNLTYNINMNLNFMHHDKKDVDLIIWSKQSNE